MSDLHTTPSPDRGETAPAHPTRREFAKTLAVAAAAPLLATVGACAPAAAPPAAPAVTPPSTPSTPADTARAEAGEAPDPEAVALAEVIRQKYGSRMSAAEMEKVRQGIEGNLRAAKSLREFPLPIATEPASVFRPYRGGAR